MDDNHSAGFDSADEKQKEEKSSAPNEAECEPVFACPDFLRPFLCRKTRLACALYSITFALLLFWAIPQIFSSERLLLFIQNSAKNNFSLVVTAKKVTFSLAHGPGLSLKNVVVSKRDSNKILAKAKQIFITPDIWNCLKGKISLKNLVLIEPDISLIRNKNGVWNFDQSAQSGKSDMPENTIAHAVKIFQGNIEIEDHFVAAKSIVTNIRNLSVNIENNEGFAPSPMLVKGIVVNNKNRLSSGVPSLRSADKKYSTFSMDGTIRQLGGRSNSRNIFTGKIRLDNFDTNRYKPYLQKFIDPDKTSANISLSLSMSSVGEKISAEGKIDLHNLKMESQNNLTREIGSSPMQVVFVLSTKGETLYVDKMAMTSSGISVLAKGKIEKIYDIDPHLALTLKTNSIRISHLKKFILQTGIPPFIAKFIRENLYHGQIAVSDLSINSRLSELVEKLYKKDFSFLSGRLHADNWRIGFKNLSYAFENSGADIQFSGDQITFKNITSYYADSSIAGSSGIIKNIFSKPIVEMQIEADIDLADAKELLMARIDSERIRNQLEQVESIEGTLKSHLTVHAMPDKPLGNLRAEGNLEFADVTMKHKKSALTITGLKGVITSDMKNLTFKNIKWLAGESPCRLSGTINSVFGKNAKINLHLASETGLGDLKKFAFGKRIKDGKGFAAIDVDVTGPIENIKAKGVIDLTNAAYSVATIIEKKEGIPAHLLFNGSVSKGDRLKVENISVLAGDSRIDVSGKIDDFLKGKGLEIIIKMEKARVDDFDQFFAFIDDVDSNGTVSGLISVKADKDMKLIFGGNIKLRNADFRIPVLDDNFSRTDGTIRLVGDKIFLDDVTGWFGTGSFEMNGFGQLGPHPEFTLNVEADAVHLDELFGDDDTEDNTDAEANYLDCPWHINIMSKRGRLGILRYSDLSGKIEYKNDRFDLRPFTFKAHGGKFDYTGVIKLLDMPDGSVALQTQTSANITQIDMKRFLGEAVKSEKAISGLFDMRGEFSATGKNWHEIERDLDGKFILTSKKGVIRRFDVLSKIFSLLNFSQYFKLKSPDLDVNGMPFDGINASFVMHKGVAETEDMLVDSEAIRLSAIGSYNLPDNSVKMTVGAAPFVMIDRVISSIPVAGYVLTGDNGSFLGTSFNVEGSLADPEVTIVPIESLAKGILGTLERLLTLPVKAAEQFGDKKKNDNLH